MKNNIFEITDLKCSYNNVNTVLEIEKLLIPKSSLVFILGVSGGGKSTLLETLGLMNNTIKSGSVILNASNNQSYQIDKMWDKGVEHDMSLIRSSFYSFIFQSTNLFKALI